VAALMGGDGLNVVLVTGFVVGVLAAGVRLAVPILLAALGEIVTERAGVLNLGLEGIMLAGALAGFVATAWAEPGLPPGMAWLAPWLGLGAGALAGVLMGLVMAVLTVSLRTDQVVAGIMLVALGQGGTTYVYREAFGSLTARITPLGLLSIPVLGKIPVVGPVLFVQDPATYLSLAIVAGVSFLLFRTGWGLALRAVGEHPAAADTAGINVACTRYAAVLLGSALAGLGGAVLSVVQLGLFKEGVTAGRGWIAVALVIFARWRPGLALAGALLFGCATALQFRLQALDLPWLPYELLLMLPYILTLLVLLRAGAGDDAPAALGTPYGRDQGHGG
jgi:general nucleoside transport system permease protein